MKGDFTRRTVRRARQRGYIATLEQQGRVRDPSVANEDREVGLALRETLIRDAVGRCGAPKDASGFGVDLSSGQVRLSAGRYYVDGLMAETEAIAAAQQPFVNGEGEFADTPSNALLYLEAWTRTVTERDDPDMAEPDLGGVDTDVRVQTVWRVRTIPLSATGMDADAVRDAVARCEPLDIPGWSAESAGTLAAGLADLGDEEDGLCALPPGSRYRSTESQLYRVEIHRGGAVGDATFKWSRENASVEARLSFDGTHYIARPATKDPHLTIAPGDWVELVSPFPPPPAQGERFDVFNLNQLTKIDTFDPDTGMITFDPPLDLTRPQYAGLAVDQLKLVRWDQRGPGAQPMGVVTGANASLEAGVEVTFEGEFRTGDYWLIPARTTTGGLIWPGGEDAPHPPEGERVHYAPLAIIDDDGAVSDLRCILPPLSCLTADDVSYDPSDCSKVSAPNDPPRISVQEALDRLCRETAAEGCSYSIGEGGAYTTLDEAFDDLIDKGHDEISLCLRPGDHALPGRVLDSSGPAERAPRRIRISGAGGASRIRLQEASLRFANCLEVRLGDLALIAAGVDNALDFDRCNTVVMDGCQLDVETAGANGAAVRFTRTAERQIRNCTISARERGGGERLADVIAAAQARASGGTTHEVAAAERRVEAARDHVMQLGYPASNANTVTIIDAMAKTLERVALAFDDPYGDTNVVDCDIRGRTRLYGAPEYGPLVFTGVVEILDILKAIGDWPLVATGTIIADGVAPESEGASSDLAAEEAAPSAEAIAATAAAATDNPAVEMEILPYLEGRNALIRAGRLISGYVENGSLFDFVGNIAPREEEGVTTPPIGRMRFAGNRMGRISVRDVSPASAQDWLAKEDGLDFTLQKVVEHLIFEGNIIQAEDSLVAAKHVTLDANHFDPVLWTPQHGQLAMGAFALRGAATGNQAYWPDGDEYPDIVFVSLIGGLHRVTKKAANVDLEVRG